MTVLENEFLKVAIDLKGAQLSSFYNKQTGIEHLWQANPDIWPWHSPNLFPIVGGLINNQLLVEGQAYEMARHGFARQSEFILLEADEVSASFSLPYCEKKLLVYPYKFDYQVLYTLIDNSLRITHKVINLDKKTIYFSVGGHPAFNVPFFKGENYEDYYLEFETDEHLEANMLSADGFFTGETHPVATPGNKLHLTRHLFDADALVFKQLNSRMVSIKSKKHDQSVSVEFPHYNYLGVWAKPGADFVCIEPWLGCADTQDHHVNINKKEAIQTLHAGHVFEAPYFISF
ncbi:aldose 1-epimerase family protein [Mucilaginibacter lappiensis]|uniref:Galactose mutarotase-like enzyme n=1 Tax=Mucilaginibacter lappiensis TaxID=354630 RepID=A0A1N7FFX9_9SPHI|nr:aldose 1-epimerase family protein [Mucilaginibacter lappiensis]MBB6112185.1 galactose mutarotase-like enzyme [Mucilaginibacter lappiensis]MBB6129012.1 galactose mutarotase-like enzyme [Mucilaginibacter lappiensis]SIR99135.1 Galactose mutarotase [Mucilaginibacter lappiensis]